VGAALALAAGLPRRATAAVDRLSAAVQELPTAAGAKALAVLGAAIVAAVAQGRHRGVLGRHLKPVEIGTAGDRPQEDQQRGHRRTRSASTSPLGAGHK
jgi:hypothetical protein